jgi:hypothetical protein
MTVISTTISGGLVPGYKSTGIDLTVTSTGAVFGNTYAVYASDLFSNPVVINAGLLSATEIAVFMNNSGAYLENSGVISGWLAGLDLTAGRMANNGQIIGGTIGVVTGPSATLQQGQNGQIYGTTIGLYADNSAITNDGAIAGGKIGFVNIGGTLTNEAGGVIKGNEIGIAQQQGNVFNAGTVIGYTSGAGIAGGGSFTNTGTISGLSDGFSLYGTWSSAEMTNTGRISGFVNGARLVDGVIINGGTLLGGSNGVVVYSGNLYNWSSIGGGTFGVTMASGYLFNANHISGGLIGVYQAAGRFTNDGVVSYSVLGAAFGTVAATNAGAIIGSDIGVMIAGGELTDTGIITGGRYAVEGLDAFTLALTAGARLTGKVVDQSGDGLLVLENNGAGTVAGLGTSFNGFSTIDITAGAAWTLEGNAAGVASGQRINGFAAGDTLIIDGFSAISQTMNDTGVTLNGATGSLTLDLRNNSMQQYVSITSADGNTTITTAPDGSRSIISNTYLQTVYLGSGYFASEVSITGSGSVYGWNYAVVVNSSADSLTNSGSVRGGYDGVSIDNGVLLNSGMINGHYLAGIELVSGLAVNSGTMSGSSYGAWVTNGTVINSGLITGNIGINDIFGNTVTVINSGTISGVMDAVLAFSNMDLIVTPNAVFNGPVDLAGTLDLSGSSAGTLDMGGSFSGDFGLVFDAGAHWLAEGQSSDFAHAQGISGFTAGDTIQIDGFSATSETFISGTGLVLRDDLDSVTLDFQGSVGAADFAVTNNAAGVAITEAAVPCFCPGTRIATARGNVAVEALEIGDLVKTAAQGFQPVRWIGRRAYDGRFIKGNHLALPVKIRRHALGFNVPARDLFVSPGHAVCEGGVLVHAWRLVNDVSITQAESVDRVEYFHVELDQHAVIFAENTPVESFLDNGCRGQFENAAEAPPALAQTPCLPLLEDGFYLARLKARIEARAGLVAPAVPGPLRGNIDRTGPRLFGWAQDEAAPEVAVELELLCGGVVVARFVANRYRADLRAAGLGSGCHAFELDMPPLSGPFTLRRARDGAVLGAAGGWVQRAA